MKYSCSLSNPGWANKANARQGGGKKANRLEHVSTATGRLQGLLSTWRTRLLQAAGFVWNGCTVTGGTSAGTIFTTLLIKMLSTLLPALALCTVHANINSASFLVIMMISSGLFSALFQTVFGLLWRLQLQYSRCCLTIKHCLSHSLTYIVFNVYCFNLCKDCKTVVGTIIFTIITLYTLSSQPAGNILDTSIDTRLIQFHA